MELKLVIINWHKIGHIKYEIMINNNYQQCSPAINTHYEGPLSSQKTYKFLLSSPKVYSPASSHINNSICLQPVIQNQLYSLSTIGISPESQPFSFDTSTTQTVPLSERLQPSVPAPHNSSVPTRSL
jgi:hypothetical protein